MVVAVVEDKLFTDQGKKRLRLNSRACKQAAIMGDAEAGDLDWWTSFCGACARFELIESLVSTYLASQAL